MANLSYFTAFLTTIHARIDLARLSAWSRRDLRTHRAIGHENQHRRERKLSLDRIAANRQPGVESGVEVYDRISRLRVTSCDDLIRSTRGNIIEPKTPALIDEKRLLVGVRWPAAAAAAAAAAARATRTMRRAPRRSLRTWAEGEGKGDDGRRIRAIELR